MTREKWMVEGIGGSEFVERHRQEMERGRRSLECIAVELDRRGEMLLELSLIFIRSGEIENVRQVVVFSLVDPLHVDLMRFVLPTSKLRALLDQFFEMSSLLVVETSRTDLRMVVTRSVES